MAEMVGMGEIKVVHGVGEILTALGLGSCIGICAYDWQNRVAGMAHVVLPESIHGDKEQPGKFAETAVPALIAAMVKAGASSRNIIVAMAGGAQLFAFTGKATQLDIGNRNAAAVTRALERHSLPIVAKDVGGKTGRTVHLDAGNGCVKVRVIGQPERHLADLSNPRFSFTKKTAD